MNKTKGDNGNMRTKTKIKAGIIVVCWWPEQQADSQAGTGL